GRGGHRQVDALARVLRLIGYGEAVRWKRPVRRVRQSEERLDCLLAPSGALVALCSRCDEQQGGSGPDRCGSHRPFTLHVTPRSDESMTKSELPITPCTISCQLVRAETDVEMPELNRQIDARCLRCCSSEKPCVFNAMEAEITCLDAFGGGQRNGTFRP